MIKKFSSLVITLLLILIFCSPIAKAGVSSDLTNFFNGMGFDSNTTTPTAYKNQQGGYYSGGSLYARDSVRDTQIASITLPSFHSGCGGIDLFTGGYSFVNSQEIQAAMKQVMGNTMGYTFNLALETATPELANVMKYIEDMSNEVNNANINSCEAAAGLVGSVWPKTHTAQQQVCQDIGTSNGMFTDWASARQGCGPGTDSSANMDTVFNSSEANSPEYKGMLKKSGNIAWKAAQQNSFLQGDTELAEFFMSLSGTIIINNSTTQDSPNNQYKVLSSLATDQQLLNVLLHGGSTKIYQCDEPSEDGCLNPTLTSVQINQQDALQAHVLSLLQDMTDKISSKDGQELTTEEQGLLQSTSLPIYKILDVQSAFAGGKDTLDLSSYADAIATDILFQYLNENLSVISSSAGSLQYPDNIMAQFSDSLKEAKASIRGAQQTTHAQIAAADQIIHQTQNVEQMLSGEISSQLTDTIKWADTLRE